MKRRSVLRSGIILLPAFAGCSTQNDSATETSPDTAIGNCESLPSERLGIQMRNFTESEVDLEITIRGEDRQSIVDTAVTLAPYESDGYFHEISIDISETGEYSVEASTSQLSTSYTWQVRDSCDSIGVNIAKKEISIRPLGEG